jgi:hypothetical protein
MTTKDQTTTQQKQEIYFAISGPIINGPNGIIDADSLNLPSNDLVGIIEWVLSQDLGPHSIPVAVCKDEEIYAVDQKRVLAVMKNYDSAQLLTVPSRLVEDYKKAYVFGGMGEIQ